MAGKMTLREAAIRVLTERGPLHYQELTQAVLDAGLAPLDREQGPQVEHQPVGADVGGEEGAVVLFGVGEALELARLRPH